MWFAEVLSIGFIVFGIFGAINVWLLIGFAFSMAFSDTNGDVHYSTLIIVCLTFPLFIMMTIAKQLHTTETEEHDHAEG